MKTSCITLITAIATSISAIATAVMAVFTCRTLRQNKKQLSELRRQWDEQNTLKLAPFFVKSDGKVYLRLQNYSNQYACDVLIVIEKEDTTKGLDWFERLKPNLDKTVLNIEPYGYKDLILVCEYFPEHIFNGTLTVKVSVGGIDNSTYELSLTELNVVNR